MKNLLKTTSQPLRKLKLLDRIKNRGNDDEVTESGDGDDDLVVDPASNSGDKEGRGTIDRMKDRLRNRDDDDGVEDERDGRFGDGDEEDEEAFELTEVRCEQDDSGMLGDPTDESKIEKIEFTYNLEVTPEGASKLQSEIIPKVEDGLAVGIGSVFVGSCKGRRMLRPLRTLPSGRSAHRSLEIVALNANPSKILDASCEDSQMQSIDNVCKVIEASYNLYFEEMTDEQIEVFKSGTLKVIEWNMKNGFLNDIDSSIVGATYTGETSAIATFYTSSTEGMSPEASSQLPIYLIIGGVGVGIIVLIIALVAICKKPSGAARKGKVQMKNLSAQNFSEHTTPTTIGDLS
jgi:hypothetical protein